MMEAAGWGNILELVTSAWVALETRRSSNQKLPFVPTWQGDNYAVPWRSVHMES